MVLTAEAKADVSQPRRRRSHIFARVQADHYVEPFWLSARLFEVETFPTKTIVDPACGWGRILTNAMTAGYAALGSDIVDREADKRGLTFRRVDFLQGAYPYQGPFSIVCNPPFDLLRPFVERALALAVKVAMIVPVRRLPAARWLQATPLQMVYLLTPRPSLPSGSHIEAGGKVGGGTQDFAWLVWSAGYCGEPTLRWLARAKEAC
jgi:hypothetical protein